jgi:hypothetical protein
MRARALATPVLGLALLLSQQPVGQSASPAIHHGDRPDISRADFTFYMTAIDWGWSVEATAKRLMEESTKAQENGEKYTLTTARNAAAAVERRGQPIKSTPHP